jgi:Na+(H+)/acetate symporter ActP
MTSGALLAAGGSGLFAPLTAFLLVVIVSFLLCLVAGMDNDTVADFFTANRSLSVTKNALALSGDFIFTTALLSSVGAVALTGYDGMVVALSAVAALGVLLLLAEPLRNTGHFTLGAILESRMTGTATRVAGTVITVAVCLPVMVVQLVVAGDVTAYVLGLHRAGAAEVCTALIGVLIVSFAVFGGMRGSSMIEIVKVVVVFGAVLAVSWTALSRSHWDLGALLEAAAGHSGAAQSFHAPGLMYQESTAGGLDLVSLCVTVVLGSAVFPHILMRVGAARNGPAARRASSAAVAMIALFYGAMVLTGLSAAATLGGAVIAAHDSQGSTALFLLAHTLAGSGTGLLFTMVACAAFVTVLGTVAGLTMAASASLAHDLYARVGRRRGGSERSEVNVARAAVMIFGLVSVYLAVVLHHWSIVALSLFAAALTASVVLPALVYCLFWKGFTRTGMLWTLYGSLVCCVVLEAFGPAVSGHPIALFPHRDFHWFPLQNIAVVTVPVGFFLGWAGSLLSHGSYADQDRYAETQTVLLIGRRPIGPP